MLEGGERQVLRVTQRGVDMPERVRTAPLSTSEEGDRVDKDMETEDQPCAGWLVDVDVLTAIAAFGTNLATVSTSLRPGFIKILSSKG
jgi:hypothetical protein